MKGHKTGRSPNRKYCNLTKGKRGTRKAQRLMNAHKPLTRKKKRARKRKRKEWPLARKRGSLAPYWIAPILREQENQEERPDEKEKEDSARC